MADRKPVDTLHLTEDLNEGLIKTMRRQVAENALTLLRNVDATVFLCYEVGRREKRSLHWKGLTGDNEFSRRMRADYNAHVYFFDYSWTASGRSGASAIEHRYDVCDRAHNYARFPARNFAISQPVAWLLQQLQEKNRLSYTCIW